MADSPARKRRRKFKPRRVHPPADWSDRLYLTMAPSDLAKFKFLLEGYDNLGNLSVVDRRKAVLQMFFGPHQRREVDEFLRAAAEHIEFTVRDLSAKPESGS